MTELKSGEKKVLRNCQLLRAGNRMLLFKRCLWGICSLETIRFVVELCSEAIKTISRLLALFFYLFLGP